MEKVIRSDWIEVALGEIQEIERGGSPRPIKRYITDSPDGINWIKIGDTSPNSKYIESAQQKIIKEGLNKTRLVKEGEFLLSNSMSFGRPYILKIRGAIHDGWLVLRDRLPNIIEKNYLYYVLSSPNLYSQFQKLAAGSTVKNLNIGLASIAKIPLPPLPEQRAIVAKLERLFSELDQGIASLQTARKQLDLYRQAVLKQAFEGELTREWRARQSDLPTAEALLDQIEEARAEHHAQQMADWKQQVAEWEAQGKQGKKPRKPGKMLLFDSPVRNLNLEIPSGWVFTCLGNLSYGVEYGTSAKSHGSGDVPVIRMGNLQNGLINWTDLKYTSDSDEIERYSLSDGDVLFNRTNSPELVGKSAIFSGERPALFAGYLIRVNHLRHILLGRYLNYFLNSHSAKVYGNFVKTDGVNQSNINGKKLSNYPIPFCSLPEQHQIVQEIESRLSVCDKLAEDIAAGLQQAEALRQSLLKQAFEGRLLTESELAACRKEADWEPAEVLLERIRKSK